MSDTLLVSRTGPVLTLTLNRPARRNALTLELAGAITEAVVGAGRDPSVRAVVLTGASGHFSSGADLAANLEGINPSPEGRSKLVETALVGAFHPMLLAVWECPKPTLALLSGATVGISFSMALACDVRLMAANAYLTTGFVARGLCPDGGLPWLLQRHAGLGRGMGLLLEPQLRLGAAEAVDLGLASKVFQELELEATGAAYAAELAKGAPLPQKFGKSLAKGDDYRKVLASEVEPVRTCMVSNDAAEGLMAFLEKRAPDFKGE